MASNAAYCNTDEEDDKRERIWTTGLSNIDEKIYTYDEAISLTGNGWYNRGLLMIMSLWLLGMGIDIFGFSMIVTGCSCDFNLDLTQKSVLMSMPFVGPILASYAWGYYFDTQGRKRCLLIGMWSSFLASFISAFSPNWIVLAILKIISTSTCSSAQSGTYTLLSESCTPTIRGFYMLLMSSVFMLFLMSYVGKFLQRRIKGYNLYPSFKRT